MKNAINENQLVRGEAMKRQIVYNYSHNPIYVHLKKHFCPKCGIKLAVKFSGIVDEDKRVSFYGPGISIVDGIEYRTPYYHCSNCQTDISVKEMKKLEQLTKSNRCYNVDEVFEMLSSDNDEQVQAIGLNYAKKYSHLSVLFQPAESKITWKNCARVIVSKSDEELKRYLIPMIRWLQDMNCPGADLIYERLKKMPLDLIQNDLDYCYKLAIDTKDFVWQKVISQLIEDMK